MFVLSNSVINSAEAVKIGEGIVDKVGDGRFGVNAESSGVLTIIRSQSTPLTLRLVLGAPHPE